MIVRTGEAGPATWWTYRRDHRTLVVAVPDLRQRNRVSGEAQRCCAGD